MSLLDNQNFNKLKESEKDEKKIIQKAHSLSFVHLHLHTEYSIGDGCGKLQSIVDAAKAHGFDTLAITDHGSLGGIYNFHNLCNKAGIKPIIGCEMYVMNNYKDKKVGRHHLTLLAKNKKGLENLQAILTDASVNGFYYKPLANYDFIKEHSEGLIAMTACISGMIGQLLKDDKRKTRKSQALLYVVKLQQIFGEKNVFIEVMPNDLPEQIALNKWAFENFPESCVVTNDVHYINEEDWEAHKVLKCVNQKKTFDDPKAGFSTKGFYMMTADEIFEAFKKNNPEVDTELIKEAISRTKKVADLTDLKMEVHENTIPILHPADVYETIYAEFNSRCKSKLKKLGLDSKEYEDRLNHELERLETLGFMPYIKIIDDLTQWAKKQGIYVGLGRGSVAGSLTCWLLGITGVDPIKYGLLFDRFVNSARIDMPDIDMDFEYARRHEVFDYLIEKYGRENCAKICTYSTFKGRMVLRDVARVFGLDAKIVGIVTKEIEFNSTLKESFHKSFTVKKFKKAYPEIFKYALQLEGQIRHGGIHAAGLIVANDKLWKFMGTERRKSELVTSYEKRNCEQIGMLKLDLLGLTTLSILRRATELVSKHKGKDVKDKLFSLGYDEPEIFEEFTEGNTIGIFQFNKPGMVNMIREMGIGNMEDLIAANALHRPGTMRSGITKNFIKTKLGKRKVQKLEAHYDEICKGTNGLMLYQEQVMLAMNQMASMPWSHADKVRKIIAKSKGSDAINQFRDEFIDGCKKNNIPVEISEALFNDITQFGSYLFNKSHATAYSMVSYQCMWFKYHYPQEFLIACLEFADDEERPALVQELEKNGLEIKPLNFNKSSVSQYAFDKDGVYPPLTSIKGIGEKGAENIVSNQPFSDVADFFARVEKRKVNLRVLKAMASAGAFSCCNLNNQWVVENIEAIRKNSEASKKKELKK